ncbi:MAG: class I SAM-dependent methyltransferase, partial [Bacteroidota bacterium]|nr:class I SAM-dependent methyltransferase [Bacteroidota bacterium]
MTWFENWFDSPYYHLLYKNRDEKEAQIFIDNLISHLQIQKNSTILDVACGKGRHSIYLNTKGMNVVGIDLSNNNINIAKQEENKNLQFKIWDMRNVFKQNTFDIVVNLFTSFGYFETNQDEQETINAMALNLKQNGILIIDFMNVKKVIKNLVRSEKKKVDNVTFEINRSNNEKYIIKDIKFSKKQKTFQFQEKVKSLTLTDFSN